ncbi:hypothetical protein [Microbispora corallina]|uniref:hypothetical protein n=1 Tax=Microbispora corallina TaxID=83302 RepID=UPI001951CC6A|nr:hypothetical protein [Microbispora corallina]
MTLAKELAQPEMERRSVWHLLAGWNNWVLVLVRHTKKGSPPEKPAGVPAVRIRPEFLRRAGVDLSPEQLIHERMGRYLRAQAQEAPQIDVDQAASVATDAALAVLAELSVPLPGTRAHDQQDARLRAAGVRQFADSLTIPDRKDAHPMDARYAAQARELADMIEAF